MTTQMLDVIIGELAGIVLLLSLLLVFAGMLLDAVRKLAEKAGAVN